MTDSSTRTFPMGVFYASGIEEGLRVVLDQVRYKNWEFDIMAHGGGLKVVRIRVPTDHSLDPDQPVLIDHQLPIPPVSMAAEEWERWILDQILLVERHEACEWFQVGDRRPFYPEHGLNSEPYKIRRADPAI